MNEKGQAEQFARDVDNILQNVPAKENETWTEKYQREMEIVQALVAADFSSESRVQRTLKRQLQHAYLGQRKYPMRTQIFPRSFVRLAVASLAILFLILALSPLGASLAQSIGQIVQNWQVGENTTAVSVEGAFAAVPDENGATIVLPAPESAVEIEEMPVDEAGAVPERHVVLDDAISLAEAQEQVAFTLRQPMFVPEGYKLQGAVVGQAGQVSLDYLNVAESRLMGLLQTAVGGSSGDVQITFSSDMTVVETTVNGRDALWTQAKDEGLLVWEANGVNYQLMGLDDLELALKVAESLE